LYNSNELKSKEIENSDEKAKNGERKRKQKYLTFENLKKLKY
jgi:hypothetical protein